MTLIARWVDSRRVFMLGDILLSRVDNPENWIEVPTVKKGDRRRQFLAQDDGSGPVGLMQKIVILDERMMLAWCGKVKTARRIIEEIRDRHRFDPFTHDSLEGFLQQFDPCQDDVSLLGALHDGPATKSFEWGPPHPDNPLGVVTSGSGMKYFLDLIERTKAFEQGTYELQMTDDLNAVGKALSRVAQLLAEERRSIQTLREGFGAAFEIAFDADNGFRKVGDIVYLMWDAIYDEELGIGIRERPWLGYRIGYQRDILELRTFAIGQDGNLEKTDYYVPPIYRLVTPDELARAPFNDLNGSIVFSNVLLKDKGRPDFTMNILQPVPPNRQGFWIEEGKDSVTLHGIEMIHAYIVKLVRESYAPIR
jgi:hypothetical protein